MLSLMLAFGIASRLISGAIGDRIGSYRAAFVNGLACNLVNLSVVLWLLWRMSGRRRVAGGLQAP